MALTDTGFVPPIDLTARDYESIKAALVIHIRNFFPNDWQDFTESNLGTAIMEMVAYVGDQLSFYLDRTANEMFLPTAVQRSSVLRLAGLIGYVPRGVAAASAPIQATLDVSQPEATVIDPFTGFTDNDGSPWEFLERIEIPAGRTDTLNIQVTDEVLGQGDGVTSTFSFNTANENITPGTATLTVTILSVVYTIPVREDGTIPVVLGGTGLLNHDTGQVTLSFSSFVPDNTTNILLTYQFSQPIVGFQGLTKLDNFTSDGTPNQTFTLTRSPVIVSRAVDPSEQELDPNPNRFEVWVGDPGEPFGNETGNRWTRVDSLATAGPTEEVFELEFDDQDNVIVRFGDNNAGQIPPIGVNNLNMIYRTGGGIRGNVRTGFINSSVTGIAGLLSVTVDLLNSEPGTGGAERESIDEIRTNAPAFLRTNNTATTEQDYDTLSLFGTPGLGRITRAKARATPAIQFLSKTIHSNVLLATTPGVGVPSEFFLLIPATPAIVDASDPDNLTVTYVSSSLTKVVTATDLGGGVASLGADATLDSTRTRVRYDEQNFEREIAAFGDGTSLDFNLGVSNFPVFPGSILFRYTIGGQEFVGFDDGAGNLVGTGVVPGVSLIDYETAVIDLVFGTAATLTSGNPETYDLDSINAGGPTDINVAIDGNPPTNIAFNSGQFVDYTAGTAAEVAAVMDAALGDATVSDSSGSVLITTDSLGSSAEIQVSAGTNDANTEFGFSTTAVNGVGEPPDNATEINFDYQSCLFLAFFTPPDPSTDIRISMESGPEQVTLPTNNVEVYTWTEDTDRDIVPPSSSLRDNTKAFLDQKRVLGTSIEVLSGFNVRVSYDLDVTFDTSADQTEVTTEIIDRFETFFRESINIRPGIDVPLNAVYGEVLFNIPGVIDAVIETISIRVPVGTGNSLSSTFRNDALIPGQFVSSGKLPSKSGAGRIKVFLDEVQIGTSDATTPVAGLTGVSPTPPVVVVSGSFFNIDTGAFEVRTNPSPLIDQIVSIEFDLDEDSADGHSIWNVEIQEHEIAVLGDIAINGVQVN